MTSYELARKIRRHAIEMTHRSGASHVGAVLSVADIIAVLYANVMNVYPNDPKNDKRDRLILSKGHAGVGIYAALAEKGFFPVEDLKNYYKNGSNLSGHISHKGINGVEFSTGSLGHGVCVAAGMAFAGKHDNKRHRVFAIAGDGECEEGSVWEMAMFANHYKLFNLVVIIDHNKLQSLDTCENTLGMTQLAEKWRAFGWNVVEIDGHSHNEIEEALAIKETQNPVCIIAHTTKGKGISFMENQVLWHYRDPQGEFYEKAINELEEQR